MGPSSEDARLRELILYWKRETSELEIWFPPSELSYLDETVNTSMCSITSTMLSLIQLYILYYHIYL